MPYHLQKSMPFLLSWVPEERWLAHSTPSKPLVSVATVFACKNKTYGSLRGHDVITWGWLRTDLLGWVVGLLEHLGDVTQLSPNPL